MGIFSGLFRSRDKPQNRTAGSAYSFFFGGSTAGKRVNERSAMQMTAVYSCVRILAEAVAGLPLHLYRYKEDGGKEKALDHPLYLLLHDEPNPEMSSFVFRETLMTHLLLWGNAYAQIIRNGKGEVIALYPLMPDRMTVDRDRDGKLYYEYTVSTDDAPTVKGTVVRLKFSDVLHIPGLGFDGLVGYSPIAMAMLTILASFAQEESRSISDNVKWGIRKRMQNGIPNGRFRIYGYRWEGDELVIVPEEAEIVKRIFQNFLDGKSRLETEREFADEGITTRDGHRWTDSNLKVVLTNVTYTGNLLLQKEFVADPITKQKKKNRGELPQYYVEDTHPAIIDKATFDFVQEEMARRRELGALANKSLNTSCFTGKIKCPCCGQSYMHNKRVKNGNVQEYWNCGSKKKKKIGDGCPVGGTINHKNMVKVCTEVLGLTEFDESVFLEQVDHIDVPERYTLEFHMADGRVITKDCPNTGHQDCWTPERRAAKAEFMKKEMARRKELRIHGAKKSHGDSGDH